MALLPKQRTLNVESRTLHPKVAKPKPLEGMLKGTSSLWKLIIAVEHFPESYRNYLRASSFGFRI